MDEAFATLERGLAECQAAAAWARSDAEALAAEAFMYAHIQGSLAVYLHLIRDIEARGIPAAQGATKTATWLAARHRMSVPEASRQVRLAASLDRELPDTADALAGGEINLQQVEEIAHAVSSLPAEHRTAGEKHLLGLAATFGPQDLKTLGKRLFEVVAPEDADAQALAALERAEERAFQGRDLRLSEVPGEDRVRLTGWLDRESAAQLRAAIDPLCAPGSGTDLRSPGQRRLDALVEVCRIAMACGKLPDNGGDRPQVVVTVGFETLRDQIGAATLEDGTQLSAAAARRLACDAAILPAVLGTAGQVLDVGRERRPFTGPLRRALVLRDRGCAFPACDRPPRWADGHHIVHWADGGRTALDNAVLLCGHHHRLIHHSPWRVRINPADGLPEFIPPGNVDADQRPRRNQYHRHQYHRRE